jgi:hypothetical protein
MTSRPGGAGSTRLWYHAISLCFAHILKVASTSWLRQLRRISGFPDWERNPYFIDPRTGTVGGLPTLGDFAPETRQQIMLGGDWTRVAVVREPAHRFLSAWTDKIAGQHDALPQLRHYAKVLGVPVAALENVSLAQFVSTIEDRRHWDEHWSPQADFCDLRRWRATYQHVLHLEGSGLWCLRAALTNSNNTSELRRIVASLAVPHKKITSGSFDRLLGSQPDLLAKIHSIYAEDYALFGYPPAPPPE